MKNKNIVKKHNSSQFEPLQDEIFVNINIFLANLSNDYLNVGIWYLHLVFSVHSKLSGLFEISQQFILETSKCLKRRK